MVSGAKPGASTYDSAGSSCAWVFGFLLKKNIQMPSPMAAMSRTRESELRSMKLSVGRATGGIRGGGRALGSYPRGRGVEPAWMERVALTHPRERKQAAAKSPMGLEARGRVARARRLEPADPPQQSRKGRLVHANQEDEHSSQHGLARAWGGRSRSGRARQCLGGASAQSPLDTEPFLANQRGAELVGARTSNDDEVDPRRKQIGPCSEAFSADALDSIAPDGGADFAADHEAHPRGGRGAPFGLRGHEEGEVRRYDPPSRALGSDEFDMAPQPAVLPEGEGRRRECA